VSTPLIERSSHYAWKAGAPARAEWAAADAELEARMRVKRVARVMRRRDRRPCKEAACPHDGPRTVRQWSRTC
jgi:hypothetical protein